MSSLKRTTRIHAPLKKVYELARDPQHWSEWYVGLSDQEDMDAGTASGRHRQLMVGTPFPLTQCVIDDHIGKREARWLARCEGEGTSVRVAPLCQLLMLPGEQDWTYKASNGDTELTVVINMTVPADFMKKESDRLAIERIEAECLEQSLAKLKKLCEAPR